ncbi:hypothetical protein BsWGS_26864 [Bradybaena similaris]
MALKDFRTQSFKQRDVMNMNIGTIRVPSSDLPDQQKFHGGQQFSDKLSLSHDDGYSTDSRSITTASIYSPLSSSLSSLSTSEGSPHCGTLPFSASGSQNGGQKVSQMQSTQPGPIPKGPNLHVASKTQLSRNGLVPVRRRGAKVEEPDNLASLEDRLRALTTIDEEDQGSSHRAINSNTETDKIMQSAAAKNIPNTSHMSTRNSKITADGEMFNPDSDQMSVYYQAGPGAFTTVSHIPPHGSVAERSETANGEGSIGNVYNHPESGWKLTKDGWIKYSNFFQKQSEIPSNNINTGQPRTFSNINVSSSAFAGFEKQPRIDSSGFYREQGDGRVGSVNLDGHVPYFGSQSIQGSDMHGVLDTNGYHHTEDDSTIGRDDRMSYIPGLPSHDPSSVHDVQGNPSHIQRQHGSKLYGQGQVNYMRQQEPNSVLVAADQHANIQPSYKYKADISPGNALEDRVSFPSLSYPSFTQPHHVPLGSPMASPSERASWQQLGSSFDQQLLSESRKLTKVGLDRNSLDLGNIPKIHKQIRAVSDLCLQASRKHMFASSADIHKLFSGQNKQPVSPQASPSAHDQEHDQFCDTGVRSSEMGHTRLEASSFVQNSFHLKPKLQVMIPSDSATGMPLSDPIRSDIHIPPEAWINVTAVPNCVPPEEDRLYIHLQNQPVSLQSSSDRSSSLQLSASADFSTDRTQTNGLSSGYSSESELQQIESNAEAIQKLLKMQGIEKVTHYQVHEFQPLQQSLYHDSNIQRDHYEGMPHGVYENQPMLTQTHKSDSLYQSPTSQWYSQNTSSLPQTASFSSNAYSAPESYIPATQDQPQSRSSRNSSSNNMFRTNSDTNIHGSNTRSNSHNHKHSLNSQIEAISLGRNSMTVTDHLTSAVALDGNRPPLTHTSSFQSYNFVNHNNKNQSELQSYGSKSSLPSFQHPYSPVPSPCSCEDCHTNSVFYLHNGNSKPPVCLPQDSHLDYPQTNSGNTFVKLIPQEMGRILDIPFETNVICSEQGNRFSTLV